MDFDRIARELLVELRGHRSQVAWSRRLGYRSNVAYAWESGRRWPTAAETFRACARAGLDLRAAVRAFHGRAPARLDRTDLATPVGVARLLDGMRATLPIAELARRAGLSRYSVQRWVGGQTQPRLPDFLRVVEASSLRLADFIATLVNPLRMPSLAPLWERLEAHRRRAFELPWSGAVLRALELADYQRLPAHEPGWIARRLGIALDEERRCLEYLEATGQASRTGTRIRPETLTVDTRAAPRIGQHLRMHWTRVATDRIAADGAGQFSFNVFSVSRADYERIRQAHLEYFRTLRAIVSESGPLEVVAVANVQLFELGDA